MEQPFKENKKESLIVAEDILPFPLWWILGKQTNMRSGRLNEKIYWSRRDLFMHIMIQVSRLISKTFENKIYH